MPYHVRPLGGTEAVFTDYDAALAAARMRADGGTQTAVVEVGADGGEVLVITCCRRLPTEPAGTKPDQGDPNLFNRGGSPVFVFVDPRNRR